MILPLALATILLSPTPLFPETRFSTEQAGFSVKVKKDHVSCKVLGIFVLPGKKLKLEVLIPKTGDIYTVYATSGTLRQKKTTKWIWEAPKATGLYPLTIANTQTQETITLNVFVMVPFAQLKDGYLNGYRIGNYPPRKLKHFFSYKPPVGFIEVTQDNQETPVAPHFKLKQFACKEDSGYPKYVVLKERLLLNLELALEKLNQEGFNYNSFYVMSGYRTPYYNKSIENVPYSRHIFGDAADIFPDANPPDETIDDLNKDGKNDIADAVVLRDIAETMQGVAFPGGLGLYDKTDSHGPFVHIDTRGFRARW